MNYIVTIQKRSCIPVDSDVYWNAVDLMKSSISEIGPDPVVEDITPSDRTQDVLSVEFSMITPYQCYVLDFLLEMTNDFLWVDDSHAALKPFLFVWVKLKSYVWLLGLYLRQFMRSAEDDQL